MKKKVLLLVLSVLLIFALTSCDIHFGSKHYDVPWWVNAIWITAFTLILVIPFAIELSHKKYICPHCNKTFYPKWYQIFSVHINDTRIIKCPHCKKRGDCSPSHNQEKED